MSTRAPAIVILGAGSLSVARKIAAALPGAQVHGLKSRVTDADIAFDEFGPALRELFLRDTPIVVLCATGIVVRALAPLLQDKRAEPPVVVVAEDGSAIVPLLGGLRGVTGFFRFHRGHFGIARRFCCGLKFCGLKVDFGLFFRCVRKGRLFTRNFVKLHLQPFNAPAPCLD